ncbi:PaaI family thioesterase [Brumimicrobium aurantiacum]|uniref:PaaI family thioesterase n=1 Tax=Brumimicrobium aurantiacum TaxID=1737063 RepID=A0A3E1EYR3_9FLAO|nr:PaaI family thioesterase [Brumimicrobium aurantiacum]RFC54692.1 PaaI family thioesterase [Brumimicrobium aurantiacum]
MLKQVDLDFINSFSKDTMMETLGIECVGLGEDYLVATMPVNANTHQPMKLLHGGASAALIESIGSMGSTLLLDLDKEVPVGIEINANHVGGMSSGLVKAHGKIVHAGKRTHVWQVDLTDNDTGALVCTGRLTVMVVPQKKA